MRDCWIPEPSASRLVFHSLLCHGAAQKNVDWCLGRKKTRPNTWCPLILKNLTTHKWWTTSACFKHVPGGFVWSPCGKGWMTNNNFLFPIPKDNFVFISSDFFFLLWVFCIFFFWIKSAILITLWLDTNPDFWQYPLPFLYLLHLCYVVFFFWGRETHTVQRCWHTMDWSRKNNIFFSILYSLHNNIALNSCFSLSYLLQPLCHNSVLTSLNIWHWACA